MVLFLIVMLSAWVMPINVLTLLGLVFILVFCMVMLFFLSIVNPTSVNVALLQSSIMLLFLNPIPSLMNVPSNIALVYGSSCRCPFFS